MLFSKLIGEIDCTDGLVLGEAGFDCEVTSITCDSRRVEKGSMFVCIRGGSFDGHDFAAAALEKGAACVVTERKLGLDRELTVSDTHDFYGRAASAFLGHPSRSMQLVGVTGTKGKTTVTSLIKRILTDAGNMVGLIGTIQNEIGDSVIHAENTTPEAMELESLYARMKDAGCGYCVMEVSSHALEQQRIGDSWYKTAVFTNLSHEHLDYHGDMESYFAAKKKLFTRCDSAVIGIDDPHGRQLLSELPQIAGKDIPVMTFSAENPDADLAAKDIVCHPESVQFKLVYNGKEYPIDFAMPGLFSVRNALAAVGACLQLGLEIGQIVASLQKVTGVKGRIEIIPTGRDFTVITDYAHAPDPLENVLSSLKETVRGRLVCLFGCGGDRDRTKRPLMAAAAAKYADFVIVTSDNPRTEDPQAIIDEILPGLEGFDTPHVTIVNRREAIYYAVKNAQPGDTIVLAGKGHEDYQIIGHEKFHFDEREVVAEALAQTEVQ